MKLLEIINNICRDGARLILLPAWRRRISSLGRRRHLQQRQRIIRHLLESRLSKWPTPWRILMWEAGGMTDMLEINGAIATALRLRGAEVHLLGCDAAYCACVQRELKDQIPPDQWPARCPACAEAHQLIAKSFMFAYSGIGDYCTPARRVELRALAAEVPLESLYTYKHQGVDVGRMAMSSAIRFLKGIPLEEFAEKETLLREYLFSGLVVTEAAMGALTSLKPDCIFMSHNFYVDWGPAMSIAIQRGIPVVSQVSGYLPNAFYFHQSRNLGQNDPYLLTTEESWRRLRQPMRVEENSRLEAYFKQRYSSSSVLANPAKGRRWNKTRFLEHFKLPEDRPVWCLFAHVNWDVVFDYTPMVFATISDWLLESVRAMLALPQVSWLIKVHPAESWLKQEYGIAHLIAQHFPRLPEHIRFIPADAPINPYEFFSIIDGGVTVCGTAGLELAVQGKPVILAGGAHYGRQGFTYESSSVKDYLHLLAQAGGLGPLSPSQQAKARRYAYSFFVERQIPLSFFKGSGDSGPIDYTRLDDLLPGRDPAIDMICATIMKGGDFFLNNAALEKLVDPILGLQNPGGISQQPFIPNKP